MKTIKLSILLTFLTEFFLLPGMAQTYQKEIYNPLEISNRIMNYKIKSFTEWSYDYVNGNLSEGSLHSNIKYDSLGRVVESLKIENGQSSYGYFKYKPNGLSEINYLPSKTKLYISLDEHGNITKLLMKDSTEKITFSKSFFWNKDTTVVKTVIREYMPLNKITITNKYDGRNRLKKKVIRSVDGWSQYILIKHIDSTTIEEYCYSSQNKLISKEVNICNKNHQIIKSELYDSSNKLIENRTFTYDDKGFIIESTEELPNKPKKIIKTVTGYYD